MGKIKVLICGGRYHARKEDGSYDPLQVEKTFEVLDYILETKFPDFPEIEIISGMAKGADTVGVMYARERGYTVDAYPANWDRDGKAAGPIRNKRMLLEGMPDLVIAFEGGKGTNHMKKISVQYGVDVIEA